MFSPAFKTRLATALAGAALASALVVNGASADEQVPPPPSSIAASDAEEYQDLRSPDTRDLAQGYAPATSQDLRSPDTRDLAQGYAPGTSQDLRSPDTRDVADGYQPELPTQPVADVTSEPSGFDFVSAAIGAIAAAGVALLLMVALGLRKPPRGRPASA